MATAEDSLSGIETAALARAAVDTERDFILRSVIRRFKWYIYQNVYGHTSQICFSYFSAPGFKNAQTLYPYSWFCICSVWVADLKSAVHKRFFFLF
jgi:hypothetical protein